MIEISEPVRVSRPDLATPLEMIRERAAAHPHHVAFRVPDRDGHLADRTLSQFLAMLDPIATRLVHLGVGAGDRVAIMADTSFGWTLAEWAIWRAGGVVVPIYPTAPPNTVSAALAQTRARALFADRNALSRLGEAPHRIPLLVIGEGDALVDDEGVSPDPSDLAVLDSRRPTRDDTGSIVFTSGTAGSGPKGVLVPHRNMVDLVLNVHAAWSEVLNERGSTVVFLPLAHVLARGLQTVCLWSGMRVSYVAEPAKVLATLPELQPTFLVVVPRVLEKIRDSIRLNARTKRLGRLWSDAERVAIAYGTATEVVDARGGSVAEHMSIWARCRHRLYRPLFYDRVRTVLGGRAEFLLSGAARLDPELSVLFRGMGLPVMEGYGLTETTAPATGNRPGRIRSGTVGEPVPGTSIRIDDSGEIWVRGVGVSPGYLGARGGRADGWFATGDLGRVDDGYLTVTGRSKDVIVTSGGKTISPGPWLEVVECDPRVAHALVIGDDRPYLTAVLFLEGESAPVGSDPAGRSLSAGHCLPDGIGIDIDADRRLADVVARANAEVARSEAVKRFRTVSVDLSPEAGWVTPTLKLRRRVAQERLGELIDSMYGKGR